MFRAHFAKVYLKFKKRYLQMCGSYIDLSGSSFSMYLYLCNKNV